MASEALNLMDRRCIKTREAVVEALFSFYATHSRYDRLSVQTLCLIAKISTPTFYRHFSEVLEVAELGHKIIRVELNSIVKTETALFVSLIQVFYFVVNHKNYYLANIHQMCTLPFEEIRILLEPKIVTHIQKSQRVTYPNELAEWLCYETGSYVALVLNWWIGKETCDAEKIDRHARQIIIYTNQRIAEADRWVKTHGGGT
ncbi:TetR/AcrR family transcriptional regulator, partial [Candidatus Saccharibacteria bacterium]|nr:TetR/AcrR family transcriptional regulator [Candidatus Saccharibacteria bacterium]